MNLPIPILSILIGAVVLFFGRKLFWLCVAAVGAGVGLADEGARVGVDVVDNRLTGPDGFRPHHEYARITQRATPQMRARVDCLIGEGSP